MRSTGRSVYHGVHNFGSCLVLLQHHYLVQCLLLADPTGRPDTNVLLVVEKDVKVRTLYRARSMACAAHQLTPPPSPISCGRIQ